MTKKNPDKLCKSCAEFDYIMNQKDGISFDVYVECDHEEEEFEMTWISVKDELPSQHGNILISNGKWVLAVEEYELDKNITGEYEFYFYDGTGKVKGVTHWMPLPEPPKE